MRTVTRHALLLLALSAAGCTGSSDDDDDDGTSEPPVVTTVEPLTGVVGTAVTISGDDFGSEQGSGTVTLGGTAVTPTQWSATEITIAVPATVFPGNREVVVTTPGGSSNPVAFSVVLPRALYVNADVNNDNVIES